MTNWTEFAAAAPHIAGVFTRRLKATGRLSLIATLRSDGFPRISPMEPIVLGDQLWLGGMADTTKSKDLRRDPRFCLHTGTVDTKVSDGDAKLFGVATEVTDPDVRETYITGFRAESGYDLTEVPFDLFSADITGGSSVEVAGDRLDIHIWRPGEAERVVHKD
ncbi:pyridoxamine 5'-phosphate oxidase family protein [Fodinicola acaciae]|uniref:pyridoxamine 5'-phosphate oxidase family protein n=1 Tax=Fodinicola acaciae TaxID=2681555 RepID=UPI0013D2A053|nr:pyridoxamine 5'-phosphate oxidase family protein [Fodinicola acaciae]